MNHLLVATTLLSFLHLPATAIELNAHDLVSPESLYLQTIVDESAQESEKTRLTNRPELHVDFIDHYNRSLFTLGEVDVERKITVNGGGKNLNLQAFELGFHIAVNYTP